MASISLNIAKKMLNKIVEVTIDRPAGSLHPEWGFKYEVDYGYVNGMKAPDGDEIDAYVLKSPLNQKKITGRVCAIVHRIDDDDDKLIVIPEREKIDADEIEACIKFQEKWFKHTVITR